MKSTKLSGDLNPKGAVDAIVGLLETPACASQLEAAGPLPLGELKSMEGELTGAIKKAHAEIYVGEDDHIVRKVAADVTVEPKGTGEKAEIEFDFTLGDVNEKQAIKAPPNAEPLEKLFGQLGVNPLELLGMMEGGGGQDLGSLLEGLSGDLGGEEANSSTVSPSTDEKLEELELPTSGESKEFTECLSKAKSASDVQECASLME